MAQGQTTLTGIYPGLRVYSIGYGGRTVTQVTKILESKGIEKIVDVRSYPNSKWFGKQLLERRFGDNYMSIPQLGGKDFTTHEYQKWHKKVPRKALEELVQLSDQHVICLLCAEKDHTKCHRYYFIAKALKEDFGIEVKHL